jgi:hypothetical protein
MKEIKLTQGKVSIVDDEDFGWLNQWKWYARWSGHHWYAVRSDFSEQKRRTIHMHRAIIERHGFYLKGFDVDHINNNGLNNCLNNLRPATRSQNHQNRHRTKGTSKYKGVSWRSKNQKWQTCIKINSHTIYLGDFDTEKEAAEIYNQAAIKLFGEFACLNNL